MTLAKLNDDFGLEIHQDDLEGLTTDVYLEIDDEFGKGKGPLVFNPEYAINLIDWLRKNSEPIHDMVEGFTDEHNVAQKAAIAEGLAKLVVWKLIPSKRLKVKEMTLAMMEPIWKADKEREEKRKQKEQDEFLYEMGKRGNVDWENKRYYQPFNGWWFDFDGNGIKVDEETSKEWKKKLKKGLKEMVNPIIPSLGNVVAGQILNDQNLDKEKEKRIHPNSDEIDLAELDHNGDGWLKYCKDKKKKESSILTFEQIYKLQ